ncbi:transcriptional regulator [Pseudomonas putida]|uniref:Transcriptional regulator n=1 Tax=Pseudomonas putida TaxID=303 RepID=A0AA37RI89_PSEPU|nr:helix-turn-helix transcriptional regulator [Pseudomonas putida]GLO15911.1 transcriptional regulator [Pseudomonas putida]GLO37708.1 transcriptional regulator [Pseudomonas putida]HDS0966920.1 transcriptional regulator [Pseudomonas putida]HDS0991869.1 transcriptional regulator [Pseudomonas putida]
MNTSGDRLKALLHECGLTPSDFAAQRSVTPQHVNNWFKRGVPLARLDELADLFCVHRRWLRTGEGPKHPNPILRNGAPRPTPVNPPSPLSVEHGRVVKVPYYHLHQGLLSPEASKHLRLPAKALRGLGVHAANAICLAMPASNMLPLIPLNASLAIDLGMTRVVEGETYALLHNGMLRVNNLSLGQHGTLYLHSHDRRNYAVERYTPAQRQAQGLEILGWVFHWSHFRQQRPG